MAKDISLNAYQKNVRFIQFFLYKFGFNSAKYGWNLLPSFLTKQWGSYRAYKLLLDILIPSCSSPKPHCRVLSFIKFFTVLCTYLPPLEYSAFLRKLCSQLPQARLVKNSFFRFYRAFRIKNCITLLSAVGAIANKLGFV